MHDNYEEEKRRLFDKYGWSEGNVLNERMFSFAYQEGHANGWDSVEYYMDELHEIMQLAEQRYR